jgi:hypothetical protein
MAVIGDQTTGDGQRTDGSGTSQQIGQGLFHNCILIRITVMDFFNDRFVDDPTEAQFVKKDDLFAVHI